MKIRDAKKGIRSCVRWGDGSAGEDLPCEDMSLDSQYSQRNPGTEAHAWNPSPGVGVTPETAGSLELTDPLV